MLFLYDKEDILAYCCHEEESMNFQSLFFPIKTNEMRNARVLREISNLALSCIASMCTCSVQSYTLAITRSYALFAVCACYRVSNVRSITFIQKHRESSDLNQSLLFRFHNLELVQFWHRFQWIRYSGMNIPTHVHRALRKL